MRKYFGVWLLLTSLAAASLASGENYPLTLAQREHLNRYLPRTFLKLERQRPLHIVALGDSVTWMYTRNDNNGNWLHSYAADFARRLARQYFYPGGVRALNPEREHPEKLRNHQGNEIFLENLAIPGRCALDVIQRVTTDAFVNQPDLMIINFGINDAVRSHSLDSYRRSLQIAVDACKANGTDLILVAPSIVRASGGPTGWGITRPYATIVREVAAQNQVLFVDMGEALAPLGGGVPSGVDPEAAVITMADKLSRIFEFEPVPDTPEILHPNERTHQFMGQVLFDAVMTPDLEEMAPDYKLSGFAAVEAADKVKVTVKLKNQGEIQRDGYIAALEMGRSLTPLEPYRSFSIRAGATEELEFVYERNAAESSAGGFAAFDVADPALRLSFFVVDDHQSLLTDLVTRLQPISVEWTEQTFSKVTSGVRFEWRFVNGMTKLANGRYRIGMGNAVSGWTDFSVQGLGAKKFQATFPFKAPKDAARYKTTVFVEVESGGKSFVFPRHFEAHRDLATGQRVALSKFSDYGVVQSKAYPVIGEAMLPSGADGVIMRVDADANSLFFAFDFNNVALDSVPNSPSLVADISIDARPIKEVGTFGFVDKIRINAGTADGPVEVERPQLGVFGNFYNMILPSEGIRAELSTRSGGVRRLEVQVPRSYLFRYDGKVGSPDAILGLSVNLGMATLDAKGQVTFPQEKRFVLVAPTGEGNQSMYYRDPRSFARLRLVSQPADTWTAHLY